MYEINALQMFAIVQACGMVLLCIVDRDYLIDEFEHQSTNAPPLVVFVASLFVIFFFWPKFIWLAFVRWNNRRKLKSDLTKVLGDLDVLEQEFKDSIEPKR